MKKFGTLLLLLSMSMFTIGCKSETDAPAPVDGDAPAADAPAEDSGDAPAEEAAEEEGEGA